MRYIRPLTGLRFVAASLVYLHHIKFFIKTDTPLGGYLTKYIFDEGFIGVGFFFVLSGFILAHRYDGAVLSPQQPGLRNYLAARFSRIYPVHLLTLAAMLVIESLEHVGLNGRQFAIAVLSSLSLTQTYIPDYRIYFSLNSVAWSLSDEAFFYALFPLVFSLPARWFRLLLATVMAAVVLTAIFWHSRYAAWAFYVLPPVRFVDFLIGIGLFRMYKIAAAGAEPRFVRGLLAELVAGVAIWLAFRFHLAVPVQLRYGCYYWLPVVLLIWSQLIGGGPLARLFSTRLLVYLGEISFAFYMVHAIVLTVYLYDISKHLRLSYFTATTLLFPVVIGVAILVHHLVEIPANRVLRKYFSARSATVACSLPEPHV